MFFAYRTFLPDLTEVEWKSFYEEGKLFARLIGVTPDQIPASLTDFNAWMQATLASNQIIVSPIAQEIGRSLLGMPVRLAAPLNRFLAAGTLPSGVREQFGLPWSSRRQRLFGFMARTTRFVISHTPQFLHTSPTYWLALRRATSGN